MRARLRWIAAVVAAVVVMTLPGTSLPTDDEAAASLRPADPTLLSVDPRGLTHLASQGLRVSLGARESEPLAGPGDTAQIEGTRGVSGMVRVLDDEGHVAGVAIAPKDDVALLGALDDPLDVVVDYETTAFALFASLPGAATAEPTMTVVLAALVADLPEFGRLVAAIEAAANADPAYLEHPPGPVLAALDDLASAALARAAQLTGDGDTTATTTQGWHTQDPFGEEPPEDPDGCAPAESRRVLVDTSFGERQDHVCFADATFDAGSHSDVRGSAATGTWELSGDSATPRWAFVGPFVDADTGRTGDLEDVAPSFPADPVGLVPGSALSLPSVEEGMLDTVGTVAGGVGGFLVRGCNLLLPGDCGDPGPDVVERFVDQFDGYLANREFDIRLDDVEARLGLAVKGIGMAGGEAPDRDVVISGVGTVLMAIVIPIVELASDAAADSLATPSAELAAAIYDFGDRLYDDARDHVEEIETGSFTDRLLALGRFTRDVVQAVLQSGVLEVVLEEAFSAFNRATVETLLRDTLPDLASPLKWINGTVELVNAVGTLGLLLDDVGELHTAAFYDLDIGDEAPVTSTTEVTEPPPSLVVDPGGVGDLRAGQTVAEALSSGMVTDVRGPYCALFPDSQVGQLAGGLEGTVLFFDGQVAAIGVAGGATTELGLRPGDPIERITDLYPEDPENPAYLIVSYQDPAQGVEVVTVQDQAGQALFDAAIPLGTGVVDELWVPSRISGCD